MLKFKQQSHKITDKFEQRNDTERTAYLDGLSELIGLGRWKNGLTADEKQRSFGLDDEVDGGLQLRVPRFRHVDGKRGDRLFVPRAAKLPADVPHQIAVHQLKLSIPFIFSSIVYSFIGKLFITAL